MDKELKQLRPLFPEDRVIIQKSGIATVNAAIQTVEMIRQYKPDVIISSGCAGGNGNDINLQDVVVSSELTYTMCIAEKPLTRRGCSDKCRDYPPAIKPTRICWRKHC